MQRNVDDSSSRRTDTYLASGCLSPVNETKSAEERLAHRKWSTRGYSEWTSHLTREVGGRAKVGYLHNGVGRQEGPYQDQD